MKVAYAVYKIDENGNKMYKTAAGTFERGLKNAELHEHPFGLVIGDGEKRTKVFVSAEA